MKFPQTNNEKQDSRGCQPDSPTCILAVNAFPTSPVISILYQELQYCDQVLHQQIRRLYFRQPVTLPSQYDSPLLALSAKPYDAISTQPVHRPQLVTAHGNNDVVF